MIFLLSSPHTHSVRPELDCFATLHSFSSRFSYNFWLKQVFYLLLAESMLIRAKVNFCDERLRNQAELNFLHWIRFLESSELKGYPERKFHFSASRGNLMRQKPDISKIMAHFSVHECFISERYR